LVSIILSSFLTSSKYKLTQIQNLSWNQIAEALQSFFDEILKNENALIEEIETSSAPLEKIKIKISVLKIKPVLEKIKHLINSFGKDVTNEIIVDTPLKKS
jgi:hypothetical protein